MQIRFKSSIADGYILLQYTLELETLLDTEKYLSSRSNQNARAQVGFGLARI